MYLPEVPDHHGNFRRQETVNKLFQKLTDSVVLALKRESGARSGGGWQKNRRRTSEFRCTLCTVRHTSNTGTSGGSQLFY